MLPSFSPNSQPRSAAVDTKAYSCLNCRHRKVKCDRRVPCSNCEKLDKQCSFVPPVRGKRKRTKAPREGLHAKLKRYEELLKSCGVKIEEPTEESPAHNSDSDSETTSPPDVEVLAADHQTPLADQLDPFGLQQTKPVFIAKEDVSRYMDGPLWTNLHGSIPESEAEGLNGSLDALIDGANAQEADIFLHSGQSNDFPFGTAHRTEDLASLHPPDHIIAKMKEVYADRIDPLLKILHLPTFWPMLTGAAHDPYNLPKSLEALVFNFYLASISCLEDGECQSALGAPRALLYLRYRTAARQALVGAGFMSTSSPTTLQAYVMFMVFNSPFIVKMAVRSSYRGDTLYMLSGVAVRLARKMGLHRDGSSLGLPPFETEMRRRLWWSVVHVDFRMADLLSTRPSLDIFASDTKFPLNVFDEDLQPDMSRPPAERTGITSMMVCLFRCEILEFLRKFTTPTSNDLRWELLKTADLTIVQKDNLISQLEDQWERKWMRHFDPSNSLHTLASIMIRSSICKIKFFTHIPSRPAGHGSKLSPLDRDIVFNNAVKLLEYTSLLPGNPALEKYMWQISTNYMWNISLYVLIEARHRKVGPEVDRLWSLIGVVLVKYPQIFETSTGAVYSALRKWTLEVWDDYIAAMRSAKLPDPVTPDYINAMRRCVQAKASAPTEAAASRPARESDSTWPAALGPTGYDNVQPTRRRDMGIVPGAEPLDTYAFPDLLSFEANPYDWEQWEQLVAEEGGTFSV
ncbi:putative fungal-specific transcription factor [Xylariales sp. PMI_506]|nr:putative fungal-specific transcription factor [Xylariales sp. PMI_506]